MSKATYLRHGRGQSLNSIEAKNDGRHPASYFAKSLGQGVTAADIITACGRGEWHHTGAYANRTFFYDSDEIAESKDAIFAARDARKAKATERTGTATIKWVEFHGQGRYVKARECEFTGLATLKGDWLSFDGKRKNITANSFKSLNWETK
jgi:hypothetical protein